MVFVLINFRNNYLLHYFTPHRLQTFFTLIIRLPTINPFHSSSQNKNWLSYFDRCARLIIIIISHHLMVHSILFQPSSCLFLTTLLFLIPLMLLLSANQLSFNTNIPSTTSKQHNNVVFLMLSWFQSFTLNFFNVVMMFYTIKQIIRIHFQRCIRIQWSKY